MPTASELQPINPATVPDAEKETAAPWIVRKLVGSMTGRIVMSSYESLRAAGTSVICLSPWGDSSPLLLPCIRFRDLAIHMVIAATGGTAAIAAPVMGPVSDVVISSFGDTIIVELGLHSGFELGIKAADDLLIEHPIEHHIIPTNDRRLNTTAIKSLTITLKYKHTTSDAGLGFFRSSMHADTSLFSSVKDYLAVEKGWFSPYLFASGRRPIIPRTMTPDVVFCHGPFLGGDYRIGQTLLNESATIITLCDPPPPPTPPAASERTPRSHLSAHSLSTFVTNTTSKFSRSRSPYPSKVPSSVPADTLSNTPAPDSSITPATSPPRRMVLLVLGIKPHRHLWTTSARPGESVIEYILFNGCPAIVIPVKPGSPLVAWDTLTLEQLHKIGKETDGVEGKKALGVADVIYEYLGLCVDWERMVIPGEKDEMKLETASAGTGIDKGRGDGEQPAEGKKEALRDAVRLLVAGAIKSGESKEAKKQLDLDRAGIAMFRIP